MSQDISLSLATAERIVVDLSLLRCPFPLCPFLILYLPCVISSSLDIKQALASRLASTLTGDEC